MRILKTFLDIIVWNCLKSFNGLYPRSTPYGLFAITAGEDRCGSKARQSPHIEKNATSTKGLALLIASLTAVSFSPFLVLESWGQSQEPNADESVITVDPTCKARIELEENFWDFGSIPKNSVVVHDFRINNVGTDTLIITRVRTTCGCTTAPLESDKIAPGDHADLSVNLNTKKLHGLVRKHLNIDCNDPINPYLKISFRATINDPLQIIITDPIIVDFGDLAKDEKSSVSATITNSSDKAIDLVIATRPSEEIIRTTLSSNHLEAGESTELNFEFRGDMEPGPFVASLCLEAESVPDSRITIPIKGNITGR